ncbi:MAG: thiamine diphosphokinase [Candidatus Cloacimonadaceae bacterium]|nr:thiamine diphosphokinase [Candidatus Cloacimonadaceae bacterium]
MKYQRAWLFTNHCPASIYSGYENIAGNDLLIAIDKGLEAMVDLGLTPGLIVGDFDSLADTKLLDRYDPAIIHRHPQAKNETDTELAVRLCLERKIGEIIICNDLGGRMDHCLALLQNLLFASQHGVSARIESASQIAIFLGYKTKLAYPQNTLVSLVAYSESAEFYSSDGLLYPLDDLRLENWQSRGISNVIIAPPARIELLYGNVLALMTIF